MYNGSPLKEPPSVVDSESGYIADSSDNTDTVILDKLAGSAKYTVRPKSDTNDSTFVSRNDSTFVGRKDSTFVGRKNSTLVRKFRVTSLSSLSSWVTSINTYVEEKRANMMTNVAAENGILGAEGILGDYTQEDALSVASTRAYNYHSFERKVLNPYSNILKFLGMRNFGSPDNIYHRAFSALWTVSVFIVLLTGYGMNIIFCKLNTEKMNDKKLIPICLNKSLTYNYIEGVCRSPLETVVPSTIHFIAFLYSFWIFKVKQSEQVEALVQKALVSQQNCTNSEMRRCLFTKRLKIVYACSYICLSLLFMLTVINSYCGKALVWWKCTPESEYAEIGESRQANIDHYYKGLLVAVPTFAIFIFLTPILLNFIIQARLIQYLILELRETLREKRNTLKAMMQEAHDISSFVHKMNSESSPAMSFILFYLALGTFVDIASILETVNDAKTINNIFSDVGCEDPVEYNYREACRTVKLYGMISFVVVILRDAVLMLMFFVTVFEGCKIATSHKRLLNQALETRVFGYNQSDTCGELDSFHYYLRALRMRAKIFQYPMETKRLLFPLMLGILFCLFLDIYYRIM